MPLGLVVDPAAQRARVPAVESGDVCAALAALRLGDPQGVERRAIRLLGSIRAHGLRPPPAEQRKTQRTALAGSVAPQQPSDESLPHGVGDRV